MMLGWKFIAALTAILPVLVLAENSAGTLKSLRGQAVIERDGVKRAAKAGDSLLPRDRILTSADGYVSLGMRDQSSISIGPNSDVALSKYSFNPTTHQGEQQLRLRSGSLASISGKLAKASPEAVRFNAGTVTLGVRGTQFVAELQVSSNNSGALLLRDSQQQFIRSGSGLCWQTGMASAGCPVPTDRFVLLPDRNGDVGAITMSRGGKTVHVDTAFSGVDFSEQGAQINQYSESDLRSRYRDLLGALPPGPKTFMVRFATGSADQLTSESQEVIEQVRKAIADWPVVVNVDVVGHTDTSGKATQNDALSKQRALIVSRWLGSPSLSADRLNISGRGERQLLVQTPDETPEPQNRRVEITLY